LDPLSKTIAIQTWQRFQLKLGGFMFEYNTLQESLLNPEADGAVHLLRTFFSGSLDELTPTNQDNPLADFLTAEGVLQKRGPNRFSMASAFVDGFIRTQVLPSKFPSNPSVHLPRQNNSDALHIPDVLIEALKLFDLQLMRSAPSRSFKSSRVHVNGENGTPVPRESVYDTELMRILFNWSRGFGWTVTGQWHLQLASRRHKYSNIILQREGNDKQTIVLELLATGDPALVKSHIETTPEYMALLAADEGWVIHFTCEDNYTSIWQSDAEVSKGLNVVHFSHDLDFKHVRMQAHWRNATGSIQFDDRHISV
jgi:hypothetical protein